MTGANLHLSGQVAFLTRRTSGRSFLLLNTKDGDVKRAVGYIHGLETVRKNQTSHAFVTMTNHYHSVQSDQDAKRSDYSREVNHHLAKFVNYRHNRSGSVWPRDRRGDVHLGDVETLVEKMVYTWLNPVRAGLVDRVEEWDNFVILPKHWGKTLRFERPENFRDVGDLPEYIEFIPMPPPGFDHWRLEDVVSFFEEKIRDGERENREARRHRKPIGMKKCYLIDPFSSPQTPATRYERNPRFSAKDKIAIRRLAASYKTFRDEQRRCLQQLRAGERPVFPCGTVKMRLRYNMPCHPVADDHPHAPRYGPFSLT